MMTDYREYQEEKGARERERKTQCSLSRLFAFLPHITHLLSAAANRERNVMREGK